MKSELEQRIFEIKSENDFNSLALEIFRFQASECLVYHDFIKALNIDVDNVKEIKDIPFLPIQFFKSHEVITKDLKPEATFTSSGTTGQITSRHYVAFLKLYEESFLRAFKLFYGNPEEYIILALLPSYLEREGSSLIYMTEKLIKLSKNELSGFFLSDTKALKTILQSTHSKKVLLLGVSFALMDLADEGKIDLSDNVVMETGGMKGRKKEITREELHAYLNKGFNTKYIHSEYGMTELLSQAYSKGNGIYKCPPWMKVFTREVYDPFSFQKENITGGINIIDLANLYSCSFLATQDLGKTYSNGTFEVLGRFDSSDIRGCNLLID